MADDERLTSSLQESILTLICFDDNESKAIIGRLSPALFEEPYKDIAARALEFRERFGHAPGKSHIDDLFDHILSDPEHKRHDVYMRLLRGMMAQAPGLNAPYVVSRVSEFIERQQLKAGVLKAAARYQEGGETLTADVRRIMLDALDQKVGSSDPGTFMTDRDRVLSFLGTHTEALPLGIPEFDHLGIGPVRKELLLFFGPRGRGKTWFLIHTARRALLHRLKVCHISLEMSEERIMQRYMQALFGVAKRPDEYNQTFFERDDLGRLKDLYQETARPRHAISDPNIKKFLNSKLDQFGLRLAGMVVKQFPTGELTIPELVSYLDGLETIHRFVPDVLMIDYPDLMSLDANNYRVSLGKVIEKIRGLCIKRNIAGVCPSQVNREGEDAKDIRAKHAAEDISKLATADTVLAYMQTDDEKALGLARLKAIKVRNDESGVQLLITQNYKIGQFCLDSIAMRPKYNDKIKALLGERNDEGAADD